ncbi:transposase, partial [Colletotrichum incanum]
MFYTIKYNIDETGILKGKGSNRLVLGRAETKSVRKKQPGSRAWCYINNVYLLFLPLHTSYVLQPLHQSVFSPVKSAYRKELRYLSQNFISYYKKARLAGLTAQNIKSGWKYTGLWPVAIAKPLISSLLLPASNPLLTPLNKTSQARELDSQLHLFSKLDQSIATQRQLFRKVKKGFQE